MTSMPMPKEYTWEIATYTKPGPISLEGIKCYSVLLRTNKHGNDYYLRIQILTRKLKKALSMIISKKRSEQEINNMHMKLIDQCH